MKKKILITVNAGFVILCASILIFLFMAPDVKTSRLPHDQLHDRFFTIKKKKEAEKFCTECHAPALMAPLPTDHPPNTYRCLFCHKRL